jgi:hypothetical protein
LAELGISLGHRKRLCARSPRWPTAARRFRAGRPSQRRRNRWRRGVTPSAGN